MIGIRIVLECGPKTLKAEDTGGILRSQLPWAQRLFKDLLIALRATPKYRAASDKKLL